MTTSIEQFHALQDLFEDLGSVALAVSGGIDSLTLASVAHRTRDTDSRVYHAVSPAVPPQSTARLRRLAEKEGWSLSVIDAGEFTDESYRHNPVDRCYYCKTHLYESISQYSDAQIVSGANCDDLADYRPGLQAATEYGVRHPFIEAGLGKTDIRRLATFLGLGELAQLPASPCLSSRVETGIPILPDQLQRVNTAEQLVERETGSNTVRCRIKRKQIEIQIGDDALLSISSAQRQRLRRQLGSLFQISPRFIKFGPYIMGSAFLREGLQ